MSTTRDPVARYLPGHPDADANGYVGFPHINPAEDMVDLMSTSRNYQANVAAISAVKDMIQRSSTSSDSHMSTTILPIRGPSLPIIESLPSIQPAAGLMGAPTSSAPSSFADLISSGIGTVEQATQNANNAAQQFLSGENEDLHTVAIAEQKAEI